MFKSKLALVLTVALASVSSHAETVRAETGQAATVRDVKIQGTDISGVWEMYPDPFAGSELSFLELPVPGDGPKLKEPWASQWKKLRTEREELLKAGTPRVDASTQCLPEGMPAIMGAIFPLEILQTPGQVTVLAEFLTQTRRIYLDRPMPAADELNPNFYGFSTGHWEGDTLVITTKGIKERPVFFEIPFSSEMEITERIRLTGPDLLEDVITIKDPRLVEPYTFTYGYKRNPEYVIEEYFCEREDPLFKVGDDGTIEMKTADEIQ
ncbi:MULTISPECIES: hypothetical protein [Novosphingobium]|uniref:Uncharacterized protein n=1 Tax=Novosphingobium mathurense TaxID=428990 RepID=A0A1U6GRD6_9SPHN|nr:MULTISPECIES: hypothetical protein [Novosphingobium]CDO35332.1 conserved exported hypothetical protein [Novosphingobium sp. KN65.2]SLJ86079.1 hypothetical protein SAMN06295987_10164 [Novosphingobium mathurense]